jgi:ABC-2 type transport system ATP-binding protein
MITGLIFPDSGSIKIFGQSSLKASSRALTGFLPENPNFYEYLSAREFLDTIAYSFGIDKKTRITRTNELLEKLGILDKADIPLRKYSKGMLQRAGLAQALINDPELVILDEPLSGLDPIGRKDLREIITNLKKEGKTVLLSSHILSDMEEMCDRVGILINGEIKEVGSLESLLEQNIKNIEISVIETDEEKLLKIVENTASLEKTIFGFRITLNEESDLQLLLKNLVNQDIPIKEVKKHGYSLEELFISKTEEVNSEQSEKDRGAERIRPRNNGAGQN